MFCNFTGTFTKIFITYFYKTKIIIIYDNYIGNVLNTIIIKSEFIKKKKIIIINVGPRRRLYSDLSININNSTVPNH